MFGNIGQIGIIIFAIMILSNMLNGNFNIMGTLLMLPGLILALTVHEYAHAKTSDRLGDPTPEQQGRLTLNPFAHMDPVGTICLLFAKFGWGKPVQINPAYYRNPVRDSALVAAAGPISNFILSFILFIVLSLLIIFGNPESVMITTLITMVYSGALLNIGLGLFNLLPFPPLDGSKILRYFLKGKALEFMYNMERYSFIIILVLYLSDLPSMILSPLMTWITNGMFYLVETIVVSISGLL